METLKNDLFSKDVKSLLYSLKDKFTNYLNSPCKSTMIYIFYWQDGTSGDFKYVFEKVFGSEIYSHFNTEVLK